MDIVSFVVLHYKDCKSTDSCVRSILRMEQQERIRLVIVDNDIQEDPQKRSKLARRYQGEERIAVLPIQENGGFSYANNKGYACAREQQGASCILVLNNDIEFMQTDFIQRLDDILAQHPCHVLGPDIVRRSTGEHQNPMDTRLRTKAEAEYTMRMNRAALRWYSVLYPVLYWYNERLKKKQSQQRQTETPYYNSVQEDIVAHGACLIFTPAFVKQEKNAFEPETPFFYEEYLLAHRCRKKDYKMIYHPALKVLHESGTATKRSYKSEKARLRFQMERTAEAAGIYLKEIADE